MLYHGIDLVCTVTVDAWSSGRLHVDVHYGMRQMDACFTFQSIGDDFQHCSYIINYVIHHCDLIGEVNFFARIKFYYFTYLKPSRADDGRCTNEWYGVQVDLREPQMHLYRFLESDELLEKSVRYYCLKMFV